MTTGQKYFLLPHLLFINRTYTLNSDTVQQISKMESISETMLFRAENDGPSLMTGP